MKPLAQPQGSAPAVFGYTEAASIQALFHGKANEEQQRIALRWILEKACAMPTWPYRENQRETDIALGRHFVGHQIMGAVNVSLSKLQRKEEK